MKRRCPVIPAGSVQTALANAMSPRGADFQEGDPTNAEGCKREVTDPSTKAPSKRLSRLFCLESAAAGVQTTSKDAQDRLKLPPASPLRSSPFN